MKKRKKLPENWRFPEEIAIPPTSLLLLKSSVETLPIALSDRVLRVLMMLSSLESLPAEDPSRE